jgi:hypothetical protein
MPCVDSLSLPDFPPWIEAIAGAWLAVVTTWTLVVLRRYAADTKTIAKNSTEQIENTQMPFVALVETTGDSRRVPWAIRNQGFGAAVNIYYTRFLGIDKPPMMHWTTPLAPGSEYPLQRETGDLLTKDGFTVEYESLSGKKYRTTVKRIAGEMKTTFQKLD